MSRPTTTRKASDNSGGSTWEAIRAWLKPALALVALIVAAGLLYRTLSNYSLDDLVQITREVPLGRFAAAAGFAALSYLCLTLFDYMALHYARTPLSYPKAAIASFTGLSIGHSLGFAALSSGAVRYRFYSRWGLDAADVGKVIVFCGTTVGLGMMALGGVALLARSDLAVETIGLSRVTVLALGVGNLLLVAAYLALAWWRREPFKLWRWQIRMPTPRLAFTQVAIGTLNFTLVAACLHQAVLAVAETSYFAVASVFIIANATAIVAHVPGGWGVIETVVMRLIGGADVIGAILVFRIVYYLVPLGLGGLSLAASELLIRKSGRGPDRRHASLTAKEQVT